MRTAGLLIENLKNGLGLPFRHENPYLSEALKYQKELFTQSEIPKFIEEKLSDRNNLFDVKSECDAKTRETAKATILEIGCYYGKSVEELARMNPTMQFIGIDITYKRVVKTARRIQNSNLQNAFTLLSSAEELFPALPENSISGVCVFFPDPWPKKKQLKNRLLQLEFLKAIHGKLKAEGFFWFKTDSLDYFEFVQQNLPFTDFMPVKEEKPKELADSPYQTAFESLFQTKGEVTYSLIVRKCEKKGCSVQR